MAMNYNPIGQQMFAVIAYSAACDVTTHIRVYLQAYWLFVSGVK